MKEITTHILVGFILSFIVLIVVFISIFLLIWIMSWFVYGLFVVGGWFIDFVIWPPSYR